MIHNRLLKGLTFFIIIFLILPKAFSIPICPSSTFNGFIYSTQLVAALGGGNIPLNEKYKTQCYIHNFPNAFTQRVQVAISIHDFELDPSQVIQFFIKPLQVNVPTQVQILIHTEWSESKWVSLHFNLFAEERQEISSGYYLVDSGQLSSCSVEKKTKIFLPFHSSFLNVHGEINNKVFLHGFEISTKEKYATRSPFQLQILNTEGNVNGIIVTLSVTTITQVNSIYLSYIAYQTASIRIYSDSYKYDGNLIGKKISHFPYPHIPRNYARIYGISGFILNYDRERISIGTKWDGQEFRFIFQNNQLVQYFSFEYIFFAGSICEDCVGFPILYEGKCINYCPDGTYVTQQKTCLSCGLNRKWDGTECIEKCEGGKIYNKILGKCECPPPLNWNGENCISCNNGKVFDRISKICGCPLPLRWNGFTCAKIPECRDGKIWDVYSYSCKCPDGTYWGQQYCQQIPQCGRGQILNRHYQCVCSHRYHWDGYSCIFSNCRGGQLWNGHKCVCPSNQQFTGSMCVECINGQIWNNVNKQCQCQDGFKWNGNFCERSKQCSGNRVWNQTYQQCICMDNYSWSGYTCVPNQICSGGQIFSKHIQKCVCPTSHHWNGTKCVICEASYVWSQKSIKCVCPPGTVLTNNICTIIQSCSGGMVWVQETMCCECPESTKWNGFHCIANPCVNGRTWNETIRSCSCPYNKIWNGQACVPPKIFCNNGRIWNEAIYACQCPPGTIPLINSCKPVPICHQDMQYNPLNNQCKCQEGYQEHHGKCKQIFCPQNQFWNFYQCSTIKCPPPTFYKNGKCQDHNNKQCAPGYFWNGNLCKIKPSFCPSGTQWINLSCKAESCQEGYYKNSERKCVLLPQKCPPGSSWTGKQCAAINNQCPTGTYFSNNHCQPLTPCRNGYVWNKQLLRCQCPTNSIQNGNKCIQCVNGKTWSSSKGCICPKGKFDSGSSCQSITLERCSNVPNSIWSAGLCICRDDFTQIGFQCICQGVQVGLHCKRCLHKPHSIWQNSICKCKEGYVDVNNHCIPQGSNQGSDNPSSCNVGTYFDKIQKMCLACPSGCLSCQNCYACRFCRPEFTFNPYTSTCTEHCGDGKRFVDECDDGNNIDGDGCSRDCKIEIGYTCKGGSSENPDQCTNYQPQIVTLTQTGRVRLPSSIVLNIKADYIPRSLLQSSECSTECNQIILAQASSQNAISVLSTQSKYIAGTSFSFVITIEFGKTYIPNFTVLLKINPKLSRYFKNTSLGYGLQTTIEPSQLAAVSDENSLF